MRQMASAGRRLFVVVSSHRVRHVSYQRLERLLLLRPGVGGQGGQGHRAVVHGQLWDPRLCRADCHRGGGGQRHEHGPDHVLARPDGRGRPSHRRNLQVYNFCLKIIHHLGSTAYFGHFTVHYHILQAFFEHFERKKNSEQKTKYFFLKKKPQPLEPFIKI